MTKQTYPFFFLILQLKILSTLQYFVHPVLISSIAVRSLFFHLYCMDDISLTRERQDWENVLAVKWRKYKLPTLVLLKTFALKTFSRNFWKLRMKNLILAESSLYQLQFRDLILQRQRGRTILGNVYKFGFFLN